MKLILTRECWRYNKCAQPINNNGFENLISTFKMYNMLEVQHSLKLLMLKYKQDQTGNKKAGTGKFIISKSTPYLPYILVEII